MDLLAISWMHLWTDALTLRQTAPDFPLQRQPWLIAPEALRAMATKAGDNGPEGFHWNSFDLCSFGLFDSQVQTPSHPDPSPRPRPTRPGPLKRNFLAFTSSSFYLKPPKRQAIHSPVKGHPGAQPASIPSSTFRT
jgi:hypothetical protein